MSRSKGFSRPVLFGSTLLLLAGVPALQAQTCTVSRSQVESELASGTTGDVLYTKYGNCTSTDSTSSPTSTSALSSVGDDIALGVDELNVIINPAGASQFYEAIQSCGYHPQREEAECALDIRQAFGFGGAIGAGPGSHEWVLFCAGIGAGGALVPINISGVHVHDAPGQAPRWDFGVAIQANPALQGRANNGASIQARAILSWALIPPLNCNWVPVWGNWANFRLRLDP
jgi:hypothetical protein